MAHPACGKRMKKAAGRQNAKKERGLLALRSFGFTFSIIY
jgi:hypothetical protein